MYCRYILITSLACVLAFWWSAAISAECQTDTKLHFLLLLALINICSVFYFATQALIYNGKCMNEILVCNVFLSFLEGQVPTSHGAWYSGFIIMKLLFCTPSIVLLSLLKCKQKHSMEKAGKLLKHVVNSER